MNKNITVIENELIPGYGTEVEVKWYNEKIVDMVNRIKNEKFLRRIYIILNDYLYKYNF